MIGWRTQAFIAFAFAAMLLVSLCFSLILHGADRISSWWTIPVALAALLSWGFFARRKEREARRTKLDPL